jgi:YaiO family outer membrane protein
MILANGAKRSAAALAALALASALCGAAAAATDSATDWVQARGDPDYRLDLDLSADLLSPGDVYGNWHTATATLYVRTLPRITPFVQAGLFEREDSDAGVTVGAYADWTSRLYSYTAFTAGGRSHYLQSHRWDHAFYLDTGPLIAVLAGGWLEDYDSHEDWYVAAGPRYWRGPLIAEYRLTRTHSDPGGRVSYKHLLSCGWGEEGRAWLFTNLVVGQEYYDATWVTPVQSVDHDFWELSVNYQRWLRPRLGLKLRAGYLDLGEGIDGYEKVSLGVGAFVEF